MDSKVGAICPYPIDHKSSIRIMWSLRMFWIWDPGNPLTPTAHADHAASRGLLANKGRIDAPMYVYIHHICTYMYIHLCIYLQLYVKNVHTYIYIDRYMYIHTERDTHIMCICVSIYISIYLPSCTSIYPSIYLSTWMSIASLARMGTQVHGGTRRRRSKHRHRQHKAGRTSEPLLKVEFSQKDKH